MVTITGGVPRKVRETSKKLGLTLAIYSDPPLAAAQGFGIAFEETRESYHEVMEEDSGMDHHLLPVPSVFLVDAEGKIVFSFVNPNHKVRIPPQLLLDVAGAFAIDSE